jgi:hypothetical protein
MKVVEMGGAQRILEVLEGAKDDFFSRNGAIPGLCIN